jgi:hypothetical protein
MRQIADKLNAWSPAIFIGNNTLAFDEPLLRQAFYQTLQPVYLTNTNGNKRGDVLRLSDRLARRPSPPPLLHHPNATRRRRSHSRGRSHRFRPAQA